MTSKLTSFIQEKLQDQPHSPRKIDLVKIIREVLKIKSMKFLLVFLLILVLTFFWLGVFDETNQVLFLSFGGFSLLCSFTPFIYALRLTKAIRTGDIKIAIVESVNYDGPSSADTLDSLENGMARGKWRISSVGLLDFEVDEPWARKLSVGSRVELLVTNNNSKSIFPLNLKS